MGLEPGGIPLTREAFAAHRHPLAAFPASSIEVRVDGSPVGLDDLFSRHGRAFRPPSGWRIPEVLAPPARAASAKSS
jgi:hypothetical protein